MPKKNSEAKNYKVTFVGGPANWTNCSILVGISLHNPKLTGPGLLEYFKVLHRKHISHVDILVADALERFNVMSKNPTLNEEQAKNVCYRNALSWMVDNSEAFLCLIPNNRAAIWTSSCPTEDSISGMPIDDVKKAIHELVQIFNEHSYMISGKHKYRIQFWSDLPADLIQEASTQDKLCYADGENEYAEGMGSTAIQHLSRQNSKESGESVSFNHGPRAYNAVLSYVREEYSVCGLLAVQRQYDCVLFVGSEPPAWKQVKLQIVKNPSLLMLVNVEIECKVKKALDLALPSTQNNAASQSVRPTESTLVYQLGGNQQFFSLPIIGDVPPMPPETLAGLLVAQVSYRQATMRSTVLNLSPEQARACEKQIKALQALLENAQEGLNDMCVMLVNVAGGPPKVISTSPATSPERGHSPVALNGVPVAKRVGEDTSSSSSGDSPEGSPPKYDDLAPLHNLSS
ncbi:MAG: hypothetical protein JSS53_06735 [Proteobacteria bacterium]|nr:hypothetical protein [Pseudomonadota bacterium]